MTTDTPTVAERLAEHIASLDYSNLPPAVIDRTKDALLDQLGCQLVGSTLGHCGVFYDFINGFAGQPEATVVNRDLKTWAHDAAFVNATFGHACEIDDHIDTGGGHPGAYSTAVSLALAEKNRANGQSVIAAIVAGYETAWRLGRTLSPASTSSGWHSQSTIGAFASTAVAAKLLNLNAAQLAHAFAIAGSQASGTGEYGMSGGEVKRMHSGLAARAGIQSAMLAKGGLTGPLTIFEGKYGMLRMLARKDDPTPMIEGFGEDFGVMHVEFKYHPVNISIQSPINLLTDLVESHDIKPADVERIDVGCRTEHSLTHVGAIYEPKDVLGAQFSMPFSLAIRVAKRSNDLKLYTDPSVWRDPEVLRLAHRVYLHFDPRLAAHKRPGEAHGYGCHIKVSLTDGRVFEKEEEYQKGNPKKPLSPAESSDKFRRLASSAFSPNRIEKLISAVRRVEDLEYARELTSLLIPEKPIQ
ncbi:MAG: MmgE/PrpD family protein [Deltaproteobacteria bacterium]|nr:MAG: MmgE/PrpD family protein [Deltaproteobacteria bacterium]